MDEVIAFKYQEMDDRGNSKTFLSKKGSFDGLRLVLHDRAIDAVDMVRAAARLDKLVILVKGNAGMAPIVLQIGDKQRKRLLGEINRVCSAIGAEAERQKLASLHREHEFQAEACPHCAATVILSRLERTPEMYCDYCDSLVSRDRGVQPELLAKRERAYRCCGRCGYFSKPSQFTVLYFYFLLVLYGFRWGTSEMCNSCMRREAWKMLGANLIFVLGVPMSVYQLVRAYFGGSTLDPMFAGLDPANAAAKSGRTDKAVAKYRAIEERLGHCAGVRFNRAIALLAANRGEEGALALEEALNDCANYAPAYEALAQVYAAMGRMSDVQALRAMYNSSAGLGHPAMQGAGQA